jgi:glycosyltransferase involved in cell wall biosynthesis
VTVHDLGYLAFPAAHTVRQRAYLDWTTRRHVRIATRLVADSGATRDDLVRHYGADPGRVAVVPLGVDADLRPASPAEVARLRQALGLPEGCPYLVHVGTRQPRKNLGRLVRALAPLLAADAPLRLVLAGARGWGPDEALGEARRLGLDGRVQVLGYLPRADLAPLYTGALAAVLPSLYEGFGLTALEAMACGAPLACSDTSSLPEVVGEAACRFDPLDEADIGRTVAGLLGDAALRDRLSRAGRERAGQFPWSRTVAGVEAVLAEALEAGP